MHRINDLKKPVAIAMWDFSWLLRHHNRGEFEDWDKVLDELIERGYNAVRIDCFPFLIASDTNGNDPDEFFCPKNDWAPVLWGNQYSLTVNPKKALIEFLQKCEKRDVLVGLSTWFSGHGTGRNESFEGIDEFVRSWDDTLKFLHENDCLKNVIYVDLLNEYPLCNAYSWLRKAMIADEKQISIEEIEIETAGNEHVWNPDKGNFNSLYHIGFMNEVIDKLRQKWDNLDFFASLTPFNESVDWNEMADISKFSAIDMHFWFIQNKEFYEAVNYWKDIHEAKCDIDFYNGYEKILEYWKDNKEKLISWMDNQMPKVAELGKKYNIPIGNTEGWGTINWANCPDLDWEFIKESAEICVELSLKHGYKFICTSNFTHPQFPGIWEDVMWHKELTAKIKMKQ